MRGRTTGVGEAHAGLRRAKRRLAGADTETERSNMERLVMDAEKKVDVAQNAFLLPPEPALDAD